MSIQIGDAGSHSIASDKAESPADGLLEHWIQMVRGEYLEIPELLLTRTQIQRLWELDSVQCDRVLDALLKVKFLRQTEEGALVRMNGGRH